MLVTLDIRQLARGKGMSADYDMPEDGKNEELREVDIRRL